MRRRQHEMRGTRRSRTFIPVNDPELANRVRAAAADGFYTRLLHDELDFVIPYEMGDGAEISACLAGTQGEDVAELIATGISDRTQATLLEAVRSFVGVTAQRLVFGGKAAYEINYLSAPAADTSAPPTAFHLEFIAPGTLSYRNGQPIQYVPTVMGDQRREMGLSFVELDPSTLLLFSFDGPMEASVLSVIDFLRSADAEQGSEAALIEQSMHGATDFEFTQYHLQLGELFAAATEPIGWDVRGLFDDRRLEPAHVWRRLRFLEFKVRIRDHVVSQLNAGLDQIGSVIGFKASIELTGLPTLEDVEAAKRDLALGRLGIDDVARFAR